MTRKNSEVVDSFKVKPHQTTRRTLIGDCANRPSRIRSVDEYQKKNIDFAALVLLAFALLTLRETAPKKGTPRQKKGRCSKKMPVFGLRETVPKKGNRSKKGCFWSKGNRAQKGKVFSLVYIRETAPKRGNRSKKGSRSKKRGSRENRAQQETAPKKVCFGSLV